MPVSGPVRRVLPRCAAFVLAPVLCALGFGCGDGNTGGTTIAVIPKGTTHEFWKSIHAGANKAARELGVEVLWQGPTREDDRAAQIRVVETCLAKGVAGIVIAPLDDTALVPVLKEARSLGTPVVVIDSGIEWDGLASFVATDNYQGGVLAAERLGELLGGTGKALMMRYQEGSASTMKREAGFLDTMQARFPGIEMVSTNQYGGATTETAIARAETLLLSFPELDGLFTPNESTTFGMLRALQDAGRAGTVRFVGFDSSDKLVEGLAAGQIHGLVLQNPFRMGETGVRTMVQHLRGEPIAARIDTGVALATPENFEQADIAALLKPDLGPWLDG